MITVYNRTNETHTGPNNYQIFRGGDTSILSNPYTDIKDRTTKALYVVNKENPGYLEKYIPNITIEQEKDLFVYRNGDYHFCSCDLSDCGHSVNFKRYSDAGTCFCCDIKEVFPEYA